MKVQIEDKLYLESDNDLGFQIKKYTGKSYVNSKGVTIHPSKVLGNYTSVNQAITGLVKLKVMQSTATTIKELVESVKGIEQYIKDKVGV